MVAFAPICWLVAINCTLDDRESASPNDAERGDTMIYVIAHAGLPRILNCGRAHLARFVQSCAVNLESCDG
jgi:hypothetical protein